MAVVWTLALLALGGCGGEGSSGGASPAEGSPPEAGTAAIHGKAPRLTYRGPRELTGPVTLRAAARNVASAGSGGARVAAVTFLLGGQPLGTDTTPPYELDLNAGFLRPGSHELRVAAVDSLGRRSSTRGVQVRVGDSAGAVASVSDQQGLERTLPRLARGDVTVRLGPGRYRVSEVRLGSGAELVGVGRDTVLEPSSASYRALLLAKGRRIRVSDLTIDGGGGGGGEGRAVEVEPGSADVRLARLRIKRVRQVGVYAWGVHSDVSLQDSTIKGRGRADTGVWVLDPQEAGDYRDTSVIRTRVRRFRNYGILFAHLKHGDPDAGLRALALDNKVSRIRNPARDACVRDPLYARGCGTDEGGIWSGGARAMIIGNRVRRARWDGIQTVGSSDHVTIARNDVRKTRTGIYLEHSTNDSLVAANRIRRVRNGINVEWTYDGVGSRRNTLTGNRIVSASGSGVFVDVGDDGHRVLDNLFVGGARPAIVLQGSSHNMVWGNRTCRGQGPVVREQAGLWDDHTTALPRANRITDNRYSGSCRSP